MAESGAKPKPMDREGMPAKSWKAVKSEPEPMVEIFLSQREKTVEPGIVWLGEGMSLTRELLLDKGFVWEQWGRTGVDDHFVEKWCGGDVEGRAYAAYVYVEVRDCGLLEPGQILFYPLR